MGCKSCEKFQRKELRLKNEIKSLEKFYFSVYESEIFGTEILDFRHKKGKVCGSSRKVDERIGEISHYDQLLWNKK